METGTQNDPIGIVSDQQDEIENKLEEARNKIILEKAILDRDGFGLLLATVKTMIRGSLKYKEHMIKKAIIKYFQQAVGIDISHQHFYPRPEAEYGPDNLIQPQFLLLYGVDFMTQDQVKLIFNESQITWINSSCCKLTFKNKQEAQKALEDNVKDPQNLKGKVVDECNQGRPQGWFILYLEYLRYSFTRNLYARYCTQKDADLSIVKDGKFNAYVQAQGQLVPHLLETYRAHAKWQEILQRLDREKNANRPRRQNNIMNRDRNNEHRSRTRDRNGRQSSRTPYTFRGNSTPYSGQDQYDRQRQPNEYRNRNIRRVHYEHDPSESRRNQYNYNSDRQAYNKPARNGNRYYDHNDVDQDNLSFSMRSQYPHHESDEQNYDQLNLQIPFKPENSFRKDRNNQPNIDLSFNLNKSVMDKSMDRPNINTSFNLADMSMVKEKEDNSFVMVQSRAIKGEQDEDYSLLMGTGNISPIHPQLEQEDLDIPMKKDSKMTKKIIEKNPVPTPIVTKQPKVAIKLSIPIDDDSDSGY